MNSISLIALHAQADKLQSFAKQARRKLIRTAALEQAAQLNGFENYQTAVGVIEKNTAQCIDTNPRHENPSQTVKGLLKPWEGDKCYGMGQFELTAFSESICLKLQKQGEPGSTLEVVLEMDVDQPRVLIYRPEQCDEPIFSVHSSKDGAVLQYMAEDDQLFHANRVSGELRAQIDLVAHVTKSVWIAPDAAINN